MSSVGDEELSLECVAVVRAHTREELAGIKGGASRGVVKTGTIERGPPAQCDHVHARTVDSSRTTNCAVDSQSVHHVQICPVVQQEFTLPFH